MIVFDELLLAPEPAQLRGIMQLARHSVGFSAEYPEVLDPVVRRFLVEPVGHDSAASSQEMAEPRSVQARVRLAWWSDYLGRKHVRIRASSRVGMYANQWPEPWQELPLLAEVYPDSGLVVEEPERRFMVICPCGACGWPEEIAWMGTECGPCHDRRVADILPARPWEVARQREQLYLDHIQFDFVNHSTIHVGAGPQSFLWDIRTAERSAPPVYAGSVLAWSPQGDAVLLSTEAEVTLLNLESNEREIALPTNPVLRIRGAQFSTSGRHVAFTEGDYHERRLRCLDRRNLQGRAIEHSDADLIWDFSPDERNLIVSNTRSNAHIYTLGQPDLAPHRLPLPDLVADRQTTQERLGQLSLLPSGDLLGLSFRDGIVGVIDVPSGSLRVSRQVSQSTFPLGAAWIDPEGRVAIIPIIGKRLLTMISLPGLQECRSLTFSGGSSSFSMRGNEEWLILASASTIRVNPVQPLVEWFLRETSP